MEKTLLHNGILMETSGISLMASIGLLLSFQQFQLSFYTELRKLSMFLLQIKQKHDYYS